MVIQTYHYCTECDLQLNGTNGSVIPVLFANASSRTLHILDSNNTMAIIGLKHDSRTVRCDSVENVTEVSGQHLPQCNFTVNNNSLQVHTHTQLTILECMHYIITKTVYIIAILAIISHSLRSIEIIVYFVEMKALSMCVCSWQQIMGPQEHGCTGLYRLHLNCNIQDNRTNKCLLFKLVNSSQVAGKPHTVL